MKKIVFAIIVILSLWKEGNAQVPNWTWAATGKVIGPYGATYGHAVCSDTYGNIYVAGNSNGWNGDQLIFGNDSVWVAQGADFFLVKYSPTGNVLWLRLAGGLYGDYASAITIDSLGNIYVIGTYGPGVIQFGNFSLGNGSNAASNVFVVKYDANGNVIWANGIGGCCGTNPTGISIDVSGHVYVTGFTYNTTLYFGGGVTINYNPFGYEGSFIVKYNSNGSISWVKKIEGTTYSGIVETGGIALDGSGNILITGGFNDSTLTLGNINLSKINANGIWDYSSYNLLLAKLDSSGNYLNAVNYGPDCTGFLHQCIKVDISGNIILGGQFTAPVLNFGTVQIINGNIGADNFLVKLDNNWTPLWGKDLGGAASWDEMNNIDIDAINNIYVSGSFNSNPFSIGGISLTKPSIDSTDSYVAKFAPNGSSIWTVSSAAPQVDRAFGLNVNSSGEVFVAGFFSDSVFNLNGNILNDDSFPHPQVFIAKLGQCNLSLPAISNSGSLTFCAGGNVVLTSSSATNNFWNTGDTTQSIIVTQSGNYSVTISSGGCIVTSAVAHVNVNPIPSVSISPSTPQSLCPGQSVTLTASGGTTYLWSNSATTSSINVNTAGSYSVAGTTAGCSATSAPAIVTITPCATPTGLSTTNIGQHSGKCNWTGGITCATGYQIYYRRSQYTNWQYVNVAGTQSQKVLYNLQNNYKTITMCNGK